MLRKEVNKLQQMRSGSRKRLAALNQPLVKCRGQQQKLGRHAKVLRAVCQEVLVVALHAPFSFDLTFGLIT